MYIMRMLVKLQFNNIVCFSVFCVWCGVSVSFLNANKDDSHCILLRCFALVFFYRIFSFVAFVCRSVAQSLSFNVIRLLIALCAFFLCLSVDLSVSLFWFQTNQHVHCIEASLGLAIPNPMKATEEKNVRTKWFVFEFFIRKSFVGRNFHWILKHLDDLISMGT